jgi:hypothetical protein
LQETEIGEQMEKEVDQFLEKLKNAGMEINEEMARIIEEERAWIPQAARYGRHEFILSILLVNCFIYLFGQTLIIIETNLLLLIYLPLIVLYVLGFTETLSRKQKTRRRSVGDVRRLLLL